VQVTDTRILRDSTFVPFCLTRNAAKLKLDTAGELHTPPLRRPFISTLESGNQSATFGKGVSARKRTRHRGIRDYAQRYRCARLRASSFV
jgi:hypothetical protein